MTANKGANNRGGSMIGRGVQRLALTFLALMLVFPFNHGGTVKAATCPLSALKFKTSKHVMGTSIKVTYVLANTGHEKIRGAAVRIGLPSGNTTDNVKASHVREPQRVVIQPASAVYWLNMDLPRRKRLQFTIKVKLTTETCTARTIRFPAFAYLVDPVDGSASCPSAEAVIDVYVKGTSSKKRPCPATPSPTAASNVTEPFLLVGVGERCLEATRQAPFGSRRYLTVTDTQLSMTEADEEARKPVHKQQVQLFRGLQTAVINTPEDCWRYCSLYGEIPSPFYFNWNTITSSCFCGGDTCTLVYDPAFLAFKALSAAPPAFNTTSPTMAPTPQPTTSSPTASPSFAPSASPTTGSPSASPSLSPSASPSASPSLAPSASPTTGSPSTSPTTSPTASPSTTPSSSPSSSPSTTPSASPSSTPSASPSSSPSTSPSNSPSATPSATPSLAPTSTAAPTNEGDTLSPTTSPSAAPSSSPSAAPSVAPSARPSSSPSATPSVTPSASPSTTPSASPSRSPSTTPSASPFSSPSLSPSRSPSTSPSASPSIAPSIAPSRSPSTTPSAAPSQSPSRSPSMLPTSAPTSPFNLTLINVNPAETGIDAIMASAQARWQSIILAEAPNFNNPSLDLTAGRFPGYTYTGFVDDIIIFYELATLPPNVLGSSGPTYLRVDGSFQPIAGTMQFSIDFFESGDITEEVILHEMAHALGFGTVWVNLGCLSKSCDATTLPPVTYTCANGLAQYALTGCQNVYPSLTIETSTNSAGSDCAHWAEANYFTELMTPSIVLGSLINPISRFTIGAMADIWGTVNYAEADPFSCAANIASVPQVQSEDAPISQLLYPVNSGEALLARAQAGQTIYDYQLEGLSAEEKQAVLDVLASIGKTPVST